MPGDLPVAASMKSLQVQSCLESLAYTTVPSQPLPVISIAIYLHQIALRSQHVGSLSVLGAKYLVV